MFPLGGGSRYGQLWEASLLGWLLSPRWADIQHLTSTDRPARETVETLKPLKELKPLNR
jgi:hypothetical protein